ncbi:MAG: tRNA (guanosine(37)-N1)-methyltransferase TrmD, partial [Methylohalobius sp.]|nr:tRNA (guanosine(37)-N1)-methyltransferase TrmD [Methylohalobius sp.]
GRTWLKRPDLLAKRALSAEEKILLEEFKRELEQQNGQYH